jgi:hypothetical protein
VKVFCGDDHSDTIREEAGGRLAKSPEPAIVPQYIDPLRVDSGNTRGPFGPADAPINEGQCCRHIENIDRRVDASRSMPARSAKIPTG